MPAVAAGRRIEGTSLGDATGGRVSSEGPTAPIAAGGPVDLSSMPSRDPHQVLGVERGASQATIKAAWRRLARENHPDVVGSDPASARAATRRMAQINSAYEALRTSPGRSDRAGVRRSPLPPPRGPAGSAPDPAGHRAGRHRRHLPAPQSDDERRDALGSRPEPAAATTVGRGSRAGPVGRIIRGYSARERVPDASPRPPEWPLGQAAYPVPDP